MGPPLLKIVSLIVSTISEPAASLLKLMIRNQKLMHGFFVQIGNKANSFEARLNYKTAHPNQRLKHAKIEIPGINDEDAFVKGVDYFIEVILFYGFLGIWSIYEIRKMINNAKRAQIKAEKVKQKSKQQKQEIAQLKNDIDLLKEDMNQMRDELRSLKVST
ncbi:UNKNOWN [Stylonychia lemnae]|uniref:Optic atrophy 3 protein n=1 Tax=Stylonychia lemnae TaxID=5949 RepID=A0A078AKC8_STYLE|nr:UNKNOWN [Stylonychia lemnae]|eukprot:CDW81268.1 UNKNOWN [Stylonychia lemnae]